MASTVILSTVADLWYPVIVTQLAGEISEAKACELLGMNVNEYREIKTRITAAVLMLLDSLPSPLVLLMEQMEKRATKGRPRLSRGKGCTSSSRGRAGRKGCGSRRAK